METVDHTVLIAAAQVEVSFGQDYAQEQTAPLIHRHSLAPAVHLAVALGAHGLEELLHKQELELV